MFRADKNEMPTASVIIRQANRKDLEQIGDLWVELIEFHSALDSRFSVPAQGRSHYIRHTFNAIRDENYRVFVADDYSGIIGYLIGYIAENPPIFPQPRYGFIADMCVTHTCRRRGVGRALVQAMMNWFRARGLHAIQLNAAHNNPVSQHFWRGIGCTDYLDHLWLSIDK